jgi:hypothetical protein
MSWLFGGDPRLVRDGRVVPESICRPQPNSGRSRDVPAVSHSRDVLLGLLLSLGVFLAVAPSSFAEQVVRRDARHDVVDVAGDIFPGVPQPGRVDPDVVRTTVVIRVRFAELRPRVPRGLRAEFETPDGTQYDLDVVWRRDGSERGRIFGPHGRIDCPRLSQSLNVHRDFIGIGIPRRCLGEPRWVRTMNISATRSGSSVFLVDFAFGKGDSGPLRPTRRLHSG